MDFINMLDSFFFFISTFTKIIATKFSYSLLKAGDVTSMCLSCNQITGLRISVEFRTFPTFTHMISAYCKLMGCREDSHFTLKNILHADLWHSYLNGLQVFTLKISSACKLFSLLASFLDQRTSLSLIPYLPKEKPASSPLPLLVIIYCFQFQVCFLLSNRGQAVHRLPGSKWRFEFSAQVLFIT